MSDYSIFRFKEFNLFQSKLVFKVGTDSMILGALVPRNWKPKRILDLGTGSGVLSLMLAQRFPGAEIVAVDNHEEAIVLAEHNFRSNEKLASLCQAQVADFDTFQDDKGFDLIVSNPPFYIDSLKANDQIQVKSKHLSTVELTRFFHCIQRNLTPSGSAFVIHPKEKVYDLCSLHAGLQNTSFAAIFGKPENLIRTIQVYSKEKKEIEAVSLVVRDEFGNYTEDYKQLTCDFHGVIL